MLLKKRIYDLITILEALTLIRQTCMMCKDQEYVKKYKYDLISHVLYQCAF